MNVPCENIIIQNCRMLDGHGGVVIGSEISGGARNIFAENCTMSSPNLERALRIKTSSNRGGTIENVFLRNITVGEVSEQAIIATMFYEDSGAYFPTIKNIVVENMTVHKGGKVGLLLEGYEQSPIQDVTLTNCRIDSVNIQIKQSNVKSLQLNNLIINSEKF